VTEVVKALVLAGGQSRRMGSDKALLVRDGCSQLQRAVEVLRECVDEVYVSVRKDQTAEAERSRYPQIVDAYEDLGPLAGILSAMDADPAASWLVVACDLPNIDRQTVRALLEGRRPQDPFVAYRSSHDGLPEPLCAVYSPAARPLIDEFVAAGLTCPRKILIRSEARLIEQADPASLDNMNTPEDLAGTGVGVAT